MGIHLLHTPIRRTRLFQPWAWFASWAGLAALDRMPKEGCSIYPKQVEIGLAQGDGAGALAFRSAFDDPEANEKDGEECEVLDLVGTASAHI